jgi:hypothetical protein
MVDYNKRLVEVDEVLNYLSDEDLEKIPEEIRNLIKENKDKDYVWQYDETKPLKEQGLNRDTIAFLSYLNMEYLLNEEQKKLMEQIHKYNEEKAEAEKQNKYSTQDLFKDKKEIKSQITENTKNTQMIVVKENFFTRIINKIKSLFIKNN